MTSRAPWTPTENTALVSLYFRMLDGVQRHANLNKAMLIRIAQGQPSEADRQSRVTGTEEFAGALANRSRGSIEAKLMNASAAHRDLTVASPHETMDGHGYRCLANYQASLKEAMDAELSRRCEYGIGRDNA